MEKENNGISLFDDKEAEDKLPAIYDNKNLELATYQALQNFTMLTNREPLNLEIKVNKFANNSLYIPISIQQTKLDILFAGLWQSKNFKWERMANEIVGTIELEVFHPIIKKWITRTGTAGVIIRFEKGSKVYEFDNKQMNALVMDFPHLEASAFNNACQKFGKWFGRDLNREHKGDYNPLMPTLNDELLDKVRTYLQGNYDTSDKVKLNKSEIIKYFQETENAGVSDIPLIQNEIKNYCSQLIAKEVKAGEIKK